MKQGGRGKAFEALVIYSLNRTSGAFAVRLREGVKGAFCFRCKSYINLSNKSRQQHFDYFVAYKNVPIALEAKSVHAVSFPFRNIKEHQLIELKRFKGSGHSFVLLEFIPGDRKPRNYFLVDIDKFIEIQDASLGGEKVQKSISITKLSDMVDGKKVIRLELGKTEDKKRIIQFGEVFDSLLGGNDAM